MTPSPDRPTHGWCPACKEHSAINGAGDCLWCGGPTEQRRKRGGWKRPDLRGAKYSEPQLRALHAAHMRGVSINSLAKQTYEKVGYASHGSAATAISRMWRIMGLRARDRIEQTVLSSTKHGRKRRRQSRAAEQSYRRWLAKQRGWRSIHGPGQPRCAGVRTQPPRKGEPCERPAMEGSDYCVSHDPQRQLEHQARLAKARRRRTLDPVPLAPFTAWLQMLYGELGTWAAVAEHVGGHTTAVHSFGRGIDTVTKKPKRTVERRTVERYAEAAGITFDAIYGRFGTSPYSEPARLAGRWAMRSIREAATYLRERRDRG